MRFGKAGGPLPPAASFCCASTATGNPHRTSRADNAAAFILMGDFLLFSSLSHPTLFRARRTTPRPSRAGLAPPAPRASAGSPRRASDSARTRPAAAGGAARLPGERIPWQSRDQPQEPAVRRVAPPQHLGQRQPAVPLRGEGVEGIDAAVRDRVPRRPFPSQDPPGRASATPPPRADVGDDVSDRPAPHDAGRRHLLV